MSELLADLVKRVVDQLGLGEDATFVLGPEQPRPEEADGFTLVPVRRSDGAVAGWLRARTDAEGSRRMGHVAALAGAAFGEAARSQEIVSRERTMRRVAERLQDSLLPPLPTVPKTAAAVRYRAALAEARVGGDFYDVFGLPDGRFLIVVGDVVGKGIEAAVRTSRITQTVRALALAGLPLGELLDRVDEQVSFQDPDILATMWAGLYEPDSGELEFASRGHPPAALLRGEAGLVWLEAEGLPLGMADLSTGGPETRRRLLEGRDLLVIYTDGVIEASGDVLVGLEQLGAALSLRRDDPLDEVCDPILDELLANAGHTDDAVLLLLRRR